MTNCEFYKDEIRNIGIHNFSVDKRTGKLYSCSDIECIDCLFDDKCLVNFTCSGDKLDWLFEEHEEENNEES